MPYMDELSSTRFRTTFHRLSSPTTVTVNGHAIGTWVPGSFTEVGVPGRPELRGNENSSDPITAEGSLGAIAAVQRAAKRRLPPLHPFELDAMPDDPQDYSEARRSRQVVIDEALGKVSKPRGKK
jgi:hypothetical protein